MAIEKRALADIFIFSRSVAPLMSPGREEKTKGEEKVESSSIQVSKNPSNVLSLLYALFRVRKEGKARNF